MKIRWCWWSRKVRRPPEFDGFARYLEGALRRNQDARLAVSVEEIENVLARADRDLPRAWRNAMAHTMAPYLRHRVLPPDRAQRRTTTFERAESVFNFIALVVPRRMRSEEIGDALEMIHAMTGDPTCPSWRVWLKVASSCFWVVLNALRSVRSVIIGKKAD